MSDSPYGAIDGLIYLALVGVVLLGLASGGGLISSARRTKGWVRWIGLPLFTALWVVPLWQCHARDAARRKIELARSERQATARWICEGDKVSLPEVVRARSLLDEGPGMARDVLRRLLARGVEFVELRVDGWSRDRVFAYPLAQANGSASQATAATRTLVRLSLSHDGDPNCVDPAALERDGSFRRPPFLPDTCVALTFPAMAQAQVVLSETGQDFDEGPFRRWQLVDRSTSDVLASVAAVGALDDRAVVTIDSSGLVSFDETPRNDCGSSRQILLSRLAGVDGAAPSSQLLLRRTTAAQAQLNELQPGRDVQAVLRSEQDMAEPSDEFNYPPQPRSAAWQQAVEKAAASGSADHGPWRLDWKARQLVGLAFKGEVAPPGWEVRSGDGGFYAWQREAGGPRAARILARYGADGALKWAVNILPPAGTGASRCPFTPRALELGADEIGFVDWCSMDRSKTTWRLRRSDLPK